MRYALKHRADDNRPFSHDVTHEIGAMFVGKRRLPIGAMKLVVRARAQCWIVAPMRFLRLPTNMARVTSVRMLYCSGSLLRSNVDLFNKAGRYTNLLSTEYFLLSKYRVSAKMSFTCIFGLVGYLSNLAEECKSVWFPRNFCIAEVYLLLKLGQCFVVRYACLVSLCPHLLFISS